MEHALFHTEGVRHEPVAPHLIEFGLFFAHHLRPRASFIKHSIEKKVLSSRLKVFIKVLLIEPPSSAAGTPPRASFCKNNFDRLLRSLPQIAKTKCRFGEGAYAPSRDPK